MISSNSTSYNREDSLSLVDSILGLEEEEEKEQTPIQTEVVTPTIQATEEPQKTETAAAIVEESKEEEPKAMVTWGDVPIVGQETQTPTKDLSIVDEFLQPTEAEKAEQAEVAQPTPEDENLSVVDKTLRDYRQKEFRTLNEDELKERIRMGPANRDWSQALLSAFSTPIEAIGSSAEVIGKVKDIETLEATGRLLQDLAPDTKENYRPATNDLTNPTEDDWQVAGINVNPSTIGRALVEQSGQIVGSLLSRFLGAKTGIVAGGAAGGPAGAVAGGAAGAFAGPFLFEAAQIVGPTAIERARSQGREEPNEEDLNWAFGTAVASGSLNSLATAFLPGGTKILKELSRPSRTLISAGTELGTEFTQSLAQQAGSTLLTRDGLQLDLKEAFAEGLIGGLSAATITGTFEAFGKGLEVKEGKKKPTTSLSPRDKARIVNNEFLKTQETQETPTIDFDVEEANLRQTIERNKSQGLPTTAIETALNQITQEKAKPRTGGLQAADVLTTDSDILSRQDTDITPAKINEDQRQGLLSVLDESAGFTTRNDLRKQGLIKRVEGYDVITDEARLALGEAGQNIPSAKVQLESIRDRFKINNDEVKNYTSQEIASAVKVMEFQLPKLSEQTQTQVRENIIKPYKQELLNRASKLEDSVAGPRGVIDQFGLIGASEQMPTTGDETQNARTEQTGKAVKLVRRMVNKGIVDGNKVDYVDLKNNQVYSVAGINPENGKLMISNKEGQTIDADIDTIINGSARLEVIPKNTESRSRTNEEINEIFTKIRRQQPQVAPTVAPEGAVVAPEGAVTPPPTAGIAPIPTAVTEAPAVTPAAVEVPIVAEREATKKEQIDKTIEESRTKRTENKKADNFEFPIKPDDIKGKSVREALRIISQYNLSDSVNNNYQDIAAILAESDLEILDNQIVETDKAATKENRARYKRNKILIPEKEPLRVQTFLHEVAHGITVNEIQKVLNRAKTGRGIDYFNAIQEIINDKNVREPVRRLLSLYVDTIEQMGLTQQYFGNKNGLAGTKSADTSRNAAIKAQQEGKLKSKLGELDSGVFYGLANIEEFVAQTFDSEDFKSILKNINAPKTDKTLFRAIVEAVRDILGFPNNSMATAVVDTTFDIAYVLAYPQGLINTKVAPLADFIARNGKLTTIGNIKSPNISLYERALYNENGGYDPDAMAGLAFDAGLINEATEIALFTKLREEIAANDADLEVRQKENVAKQRVASLKEKALAKETSENLEPKSVNDLNYGDEVTIGGRKLIVTTRNPRTNSVALVDKQSGDIVEFNTNDSIQIDKGSYIKTPPAPPRQAYTYNPKPETDTDEVIEIDPTLIDRISVLAGDIKNFFTGKGKARGKYEKGLKFIGRGNRSVEVQRAIERITGGENAVTKQVGFTIKRLKKLAKDLNVSLENIYKAIGDVDYSLTKNQENTLIFAEIEARKSNDIDRISQIKGEETANQVSKLSDTDRENWIANNINRQDAVDISQQSELAGIDARNALAKQLIAQNYEEAVRIKRSIRDSLPDDILNEVSIIESDLKKVIGDAYKDGILPSKFKPRANADTIALERFYEIRGNKAYAKLYKENPRYMDKLMSAIESLTIDAKTKRYLENGVIDEGSTEPRMVTRAEARRLAEAEIQADPNSTNGVALQFIEEAINNPVDAINRLLLDKVGFKQSDLKYGTPAILNEILGKAVNEPTSNFVNILVTAGTNQVYYDNFSQLKEIGLEKGYIIPPNVLEEVPEGYVRVKANDIKAPAFSSLFGGYIVDKNFFDAMYETFNPENVNALNKTVLRYNALAMRAATSLNIPGGPNRNFVGNIQFMIASGNLALNKLSSAFKATVSNFRKMSDREMQDYIVRAAKYGITDDNVTSIIGDFERISSNKTKIDYVLDGVIDGKTKALRKVGDVTNDLYQSVDNFWKFALWEAEKDTVREAEPQLDGESDADYQDRVDRTAADRVASSLPFFSRMIDVGRIYKKPGIAAAIGSFIGFRSELIRLAYAGPMQAFADIKSGNPVYVKAGFKRVAGLTAAYSIFTVLGAALKSMFDISDEEEEAVRSTLAPWDANANLLFWKDDKGRINYFNTSFMAPFAANTDWIKTFGREWDRKSDSSKINALTSATFAALQNAAGPILELQIGAQTINEVINNMTDSGRQVWNPESSDMEKLSSITGHLTSAITPTSFRKAKALGRSISGTPERTGEVLSTPVAAMNFLFARTGRVEPDKATRYNAFEFNRRLRDAARMVTTVARSKGQVSDAELISAYESANQANEQIIREASRFYEGQLKLGLTRQKADSLMREANLSANIIKQIKNGYVTPYKINKQTLEEIPKDRRNVLNNLIKSKPKKVSLKDD